MAATRVAITRSPSLANASFVWLFGASPAHVSISAVSGERSLTPRSHANEWSEEDLKGKPRARRAPLTSFHSPPRTYPYLQTLMSSINALHDHSGHPIQRA